MTEYGGGIELRNNPLTKRTDAMRGAPAALRGFLGEADGDGIRLYSNLSLSEWLLIPKADILEATYDNDRDTSPCTLVIRPDCEIRYLQEVTVPVADVLAMKAASAGTSTCECGSHGATARAIPLDNGVEQPSMACEIGCEMRRNICDEFEMGWCSLRYYLCRLDCIYGDTDSAAAGAVRI